MTQALTDRNTVLRKVEQRVLWLSTAIVDPPTGVRPNTTA